MKRNEAPATETLDLQYYLGRRTLIVGEVNTGKTTLTQRILEAICRQSMGSRVVIVDLAPEIPKTPARQLGLSGIGGRLHPPSGAGIRYVWARPRPPRLSAATEADALELAEINRKALEETFRQSFGRGRDMVFLNDVSLYLQAGSARRLLGWIGNAATVVANSYYGERLGPGALSERERREVESLMELFDQVVRL